MRETIHVPVLLNEAVESMNICPGDTVVDATLGGGGHALRILEMLGSDGKFFACDSDAEAVARFRTFLEGDERYSEMLRDGRIVLIHAPLTEIGSAIRQSGASGISSALADLGLSSDQLEDSSRGFSFLREGPLDMRFDRSSGIRAEDIVNHAPVSEIARILREYGDVREANRVAKEIGDRRKSLEFSTTTELSNFIASLIRSRNRSIHPATSVFQAIRMAVNRELSSIESFLQDMVGLLKQGGRIAVISFHSGEERVVKEVFRRDARGCVCPKEFPVCRCGREATLRVLTRRAIVPSESEVAENSRARSARLRVAERC